VLAAADGEYDEILCCGDVIGYGADPNPVVDWVRACVKVVVRGNHDRASAGLEDLEWFNPVARQAALWTQRELTRQNLEYVRLLPKGPISVDSFQIVHGSPLDEDEYVVGPSDALQALSYVESRLSFFGHTHLQGGFAFHESTLKILGRPDTEGRLDLALHPEFVYMINPGSVGQPRDGDARSAYVIYCPESNAIRYRRVAYDIARAQTKIRRAKLPPVLADRLALGR
jgi:diadenosine tetraphosphatase ApaH/serine/threonine PP2A family protein phosphatase